MENNKMHGIADPIYARGRTRHYVAHKQKLDNKTHGAPPLTVYRSAPNKTANDPEFTKATGTYFASSKTAD